MVVGSFLLLVSVSLSASTAATRLGTPRVSIGRDVHNTALERERIEKRSVARATDKKKEQHWSPAWR